jgi:hypothetical protein
MKSEAKLELVRLLMQINDFYKIEKIEEWMNKFYIVEEKNELIS